MVISVTKKAKKNELPKKTSYYFEAVRLVHFKIRWFVFGGGSKHGVATRKLTCLLEVLVPNLWLHKYELYPFGLDYEVSVSTFLLFPQISVYEIVK